MATPETTEAAWFSALKSVLPVGKAWDFVRSGASRLSDIVDGLSPELNRVSNVLRDLWIQSDPRDALDTTDPGYDTIALLPDFERNYGLPDPCIGAPSTTDERRAILYAKWVANGGQSEAYFIGVAEALLGSGFTVTITSPAHAPFRCDISACGDPLYDEQYFYVWEMEVTPVPTVDQQTALECLINRYKPSHTSVEFTYTP